jgi:hypothetical protein
VNSSYWNVHSVGQAIGRSKKGLVYGDINDTMGDVDVDALDDLITFQLSEFPNCFQLIIVEY